MIYIFGFPQIPKPGSINDFDLMLFHKKPHKLNQTKQSLDFSYLLKPYLQLLIYGTL